MNANQFIDETIAVIEKRGWCQGTSENARGNVCIMGAFASVHSNHYFDDSTWSGRANAQALVQRAIAVETGRNIAIYRYNDLFAKSAEDAILILKLAKELNS